MTIPKDINFIREYFDLGYSPIRHQFTCKEFELDDSFDIVFTIPQNFCYLVTYVFSESIPPVNDATLTVMDFRSTDVDASGKAQAQWITDSNPSFGTPHTYLATLNQECFLLFNGGSKITLRISRPAGQRPPTTIMNVTINGYLLPPTACDSGTGTLYGNPNPSLGCTSLFQFSTPPIANTVFENNATIQYVWADQLRNLFYSVNVVVHGANFSIVNVTGDIITPLSTTSYTLIGTFIAGILSFGNTLFIIDEADQITSYDITNPSIPVLLDVHILGGGSLASPAIITKDGKTIYTIGDGRLHIVDVTNPSVITSIDVDLSLFPVPQLFGVQLVNDGTDVYILDFNVPAFVGKYDCSNPLAVTQTNTVNVTTLISGENSIGCPLYFYHNRVYVTLRGSCTPINFLTLTVEPSVSIPADFNRASGFQNKLVIAGIFGQTFTGLNLCDPDIPIIEESFNTIGFPADLYVSPNNLFLGTGPTNASLEIYPNGV